MGTTCATIARPMITIAFNTGMRKQARLVGSCDYLFGGGSAGRRRLFFAGAVYLLPSSSPLNAGEPFLSLITKYSPVGSAENETERVILNSLAATRFQLLQRS